jgi:hypothetical protein
MATAAETHKEVLLKHGLSPSVLDEFVRMLDEFDAAVALGNDGDGWEESAARQTELRGKRCAKVASGPVPRATERVVGT